MEAPFSSELLAKMVKTACVENYTQKGYTPKGDEKLMESILYLGTVDRKLGLSGSGYGTPDTTNIALVPLSSSDVKNLPANLNSKDVAVCIAFAGMRVDKYNRSGVIRAAVVMSEADATKFVQAVQQAPELVYALLRQTNGGPIVKYDGTPMEINPGKAVVVLPNEKVGGKMKDKIESTPFPADYKPNPLL